MRVIFTLILLIVLSTICLGQDETQISYGQTLLKEADSLITANEIDKAKTLLHTTKNELLKENDTLGYFNCLVQISTILQLQTKFDSSLVVAQKGILEMESFQFENYAMLAKLKRQAGVIYELKDGNYSKAFNLYNEAIDELKKDTTKIFTEALLLKDLAIVLLSQELNDSSRIYIDQSLNFHSNHFPTEITELADTYRLLAISYSYDGNLEQAIKSYQGAVDVLKDAKESVNSKKVTADLYGNIANTYQAEGYYDSALYYYYKQKTIDEAILGDNHRLLSYLYGNLSQVHDIKSNLDSALIYSNKSLSIGEVIYGKDNPSLADIYLNTSNIFTSLNKHEDALSYAEKSLSILENVFGNGGAQLYDALITIGSIYLNQEDYLESLKFFKNAINAYDKGEVQKNQSYIETQLNIADNYFALNQLDSARWSMEKAYKLSMSQFGKDHEITGKSIRLIGKFYSYLRDLPRARKELESAILIFEHVHGDRNYLIAQARLDLSEVLLKLNLLEEALETLQSASIANSYEFSSIEILNNPELEDVINPLLGIEINICKALVFEKKYRESGESEWLEKCFGQNENTIRLLSEVLFENQVENDALQILDEFHQVYSNQLRVLSLKLEAGLLDNIQYQEQILKYSEASRAVNLDFNQYKGDNSFIEANQIDSLKYLNKEISFFKSELLTAQKEKDNSPTDAIRNKVEYLQNMLFNLKSQKIKFQSKTDMNFGSYNDYLKSKAHRTSQWYMSHLDDNEGIVEYFLTKEWIYAIFVSKSDLRVVSKRVDSNFNQLIDDFKTIYKGELANYISAAKTLHSTLLEPLQEEVRHLEKLIIIPDKELWNINFDLLITNDSEESDPRKLNYLIHNFNISYAYSLNSRFTQKDDKSSANKPLLAFAYEASTSEFDSLFLFRPGKTSTIDGTKSELEGINKSYSGDFLFGALANEKEFKSRARDYQILHLALHGDIDNNNVNSSHLIFNTQDSTTNEDNYLYSFELYDMQLNSDLVVLSACHSGAGEIINGEGIMSIGRGFLYAGAKSLLLSQWELSDAVAPQLMTSFYEYLDDGFEKDRALRQAKLDFLANANNVTANPLYWGSFFVLGDTSPIELKSHFNWKTWPYILVTLVLMIILLYKTKLVRSKASH